ncbi:MAG: hypothetical protein H0S82_01820, partial [Anaerolineaceae bacterium]|nr:hypothetical protein [Anaerolineaceae bacterium]
MSPMVASQQNRQSPQHQFLDSLKSFWQWPTIFAILFAASISLFVFVRLLDFFITPTINKVFIFLCLFAFFFFVSLIYFSPILKALKARPKVLLAVLLISLVVTGTLYVLLPEQKIAIRTVHTLKVTVPSDSGPVILADLMGPMKGEIPWSDVSHDGIVNNELVKLSPGGELVYSRRMTWGISFTLSAPDEDAEAIVAWDGVQSVISLDRGETVVQVTDPTSMGVPSRLNRYLLLIIKFNEWLSLFLTLNVFLGAAYLLSGKNKIQYRVLLGDTQRYLLTYLILNSALLLIAIGLRIYSPGSDAITLFILLPGLLFLILNAIYRAVPSLPTVLIGLTLIVNIFAHWVWFDTYIVKLGKMTDQTFNELVHFVNPSDPTVMSLGFYKQLRDSELVLAEGSFLAEEDNVARLYQINYHKNIFVLDYPGELSTEDYDRLLKLDDWSTWERRKDGVFYFYDADSAVTSPIVVFTYLTDIFLIPENQLDELG